ncbi:YceI family protein [Abyssalbus ytuae]|uniref:YceI family protein n=1 Tax=Abyssalbus ytuae TaxID=2926907 RepID=A0A9E6ZQD1_9FLAO|nr:YceI family protein [Abyssalbus ytuae]UOB16848.1 YceI family protein [Abyssalbus ytuae]
MKNKFLALTLTVVTGLATVSFTNIKDNKKQVDVSKSKITWKGYKVTGSHEGTISLKEGYLIFDENKLTGGEFIADMTTISSTDLEGEWKDKLDGHLKAEDFFGIENHPVTKLVFTNVKSTGKNSYQVTADLTIKKTTKPVTFNLSVYGSKATASLKIDRTEYGLKYGSGSFFDNLGDKTIYDEFDLVVDLQF